MSNALCARAAAARGKIAQRHALLRPRGHRRERARQPQNQRLSDYKTSEKAVILFSALTDLHKNDAE
jgi:hypothetical protein